MVGGQQITYFHAHNYMVGVWWKKYLFTCPTHLQVVGGYKMIDFHDLQHYMVVNGGNMISLHAQPTIRWWEM